LDAPWLFVASPLILRARFLILHAGCCWTVLAIAVAAVSDRRIITLHTSIIMNSES
jgi:hypothetical protein